MGKRNVRCADFGFLSENAWYSGKGLLVSDQKDNWLIKWDGNLIDLDSINRWPWMSECPLKFWFRVVCGADSRDEIGGRVGT